MSTHHVIRTGQATGLGSYPVITIPNLDPGLVRSDQIRSDQIRSANAQGWAWRDNCPPEPLLHCDHSVFMYTQGGCVSLLLCPKFHRCHQSHTVPFPSDSLSHLVPLQPRPCPSAASGGRARRGCGPSTPDASTASPAGCYSSCTARSSAERRLGLQPGGGRRLPAGSHGPGMSKHAQQILRM